VEEEQFHRVAKIEVINLIGAQAVHGREMLIEEQVVDRAGDRTAAG
jgi:hypothetical protein